MPCDYDEVHFLNYSDYDDICLHEVGAHRCSPGYSYGPAIRSRYVLHYVLSGKGTLYLQDNVFKIKQGECFLLPINEQTFYQADNEDPWHYIWVHYDGQKAVDLMHHLSLNVYSPVFTPTHSNNRIGEFFRNFSNYPYDEYYCMGNLYQLFGEMLHHAPQKQQPFSVETQNLQYIKKIIDYIALHYSRKVTVTELADLCGLNRSYLTKLFKDATGYSPQQYLIRFRMKRAKALLHESDMPIQTVALSVGYSDPFSFSKAFRGYAGTSPSAYREQI